jgi:hypothetical protein
MTIPYPFPARRLAPIAFLSVCTLLATGCNSTERLLNPTRDHSWQAASNYASATSPQAPTVVLRTAHSHPCAAAPCDLRRTRFTHHR